MISDDYADRLAEIAAQLAVRVRDDTPDEVGAWLREQLPNPSDWWALTFVLAAAVPLDRPFSHLTAWARINPEVIEHRRAVLLGDLGRGKPGAPKFAEPIGTTS